jgi:hypothetical protein
MRAADDAGAMRIAAPECIPVQFIPVFPRGAARAGFFSWHMKARIGSRKPRRFRHYAGRNPRRPKHNVKYHLDINIGAWCRSANRRDVGGYQPGHTGRPKTCRDARQAQDPRPESPDFGASVRR